MPSFRIEPRKVRADATSLNRSGFATARPAGAMVENNSAVLRPDARQISRRRLRRKPQDTPPAPRPATPPKQFLDPLSPWSGDLAPSTWGTIRGCSRHHITDRLLTRCSGQETCGHAGQEVDDGARRDQQGGRRTAAAASAHGVQNPAQSASHRRPPTLGGQPLPRGLGGLRRARRALARRRVRGADRERRDSGCSAGAPGSGDHHRRPRFPDRLRRRGCARPGGDR